MQLHREVDRIHNAGAEMIVIGNGSPSFIEGFREQTGYRGPLYTDPSLGVYRAAELKRGVTNTLNPLGAIGFVKALARGHKQGWTQGDPWQQGGVLVIAATGEVKWQHASGRPGDNASAADIIGALR